MPGTRSKAPIGRARRVDCANRFWRHALRARLVHATRETAETVWNGLNLFDDAATHRRRITGLKLQRHGIDKSAEASPDCLWQALIRCPRAK